MVSAMAHVMTDAIRSITIVIGAFLIYLQHHKIIHLNVQEEVMDGILSCFVVGCMGVAVLFVLREIFDFACFLICNCPIVCHNQGAFLFHNK